MSTEAAELPGIQLFGKKLERRGECGVSWRIPGTPKQVFELMAPGPPGGAGSLRGWRVWVFGALAGCDMNLEQALAFSEAKLQEMRDELSKAIGDGK